MVNQWSLLDNYLLFLRMMSKISYRRVKQSEKKCARTDLAPKLLRNGWQNGWGMVLYEI